MLQFRHVTKKKRPYKSPARERQAGDTRRRIVETTRQLLQSEGYAGMTIEAIAQGDRKSTRLNSSHLVISYAVFCLKKKTTLLWPGGRRSTCPLSGRASRASPWT